MGRRGRKPDRDARRALPQEALSDEVPADELDHVAPDSPEPNVQDILADAALARRCIDGEVAAWEELYTLCHAPLLMSIEVILGVGRRDSSLVEEIAARVWYTLVENDGELLERFDASRGARMMTFLRALARDEISRHFRTERRRREREYTAFQDRPRHTDPALPGPDASLSDFLGTLTPHERGFADEHLLNRPSEPDPAAEPPSSPSNFWQLTRRIRRKLLEFLDRGV